MVRQWQNLFYGERYSQTVLEDSVDFVKAGRGYGCTGHAAYDEERNLNAALQYAIQPWKAVSDRLPDRQRR